MLFSSIVFLFYFLPIMLVLYYSFSFSKTLKNTVLLIGSLFFYAWGEPQFVLIMVMSIVLNYLFGLLVDYYRKEKRIVKIVLIVMCLYNLGMLFVFKYLTFVLRTMNEYRENPMAIPRIILPLGISFFTFQAMSYVIDVYRGDGKVQKNPFNVGLYISFFPQLVAGPIVRYNTIAEQMADRKETWPKFSVGVCRFIIGLGKKVMISNQMAIIADHIFVMNTNVEIATSLAWLGAIAYTLQIYFDFSGYSDMAIGLGLMFGFKFEENFNYPYTSKSISEFWRRWHMSLGTWFKDYVYIPLGGSRVATMDEVVKNLFVVWLLTGLWHGAEWTFIAWGMFYFVLIAFEKTIHFEKKPGKTCWRQVYVLLAVVIGWVIFRAPNLKEAGTYLSSMFALHGGSLWSQETAMFIRENIIFLGAGIVFSTPIARKVNKKMAEGAKGRGIVAFCYPIALSVLMMLCVTYLVKGTYNPFIYFNF